MALELGLAVNDGTYDTLYLTFALAMGAEKVIVADGPFVSAMRTHPDPAVAGMLLPSPHGPGHTRAEPIVRDGPEHRRATPHPGYCQ